MGSATPSTRRAASNNNSTTPMPTIMSMVLGSPARCTRSASKNQWYMPATKAAAAISASYQGRRSRGALLRAG